MPIGLGAVISAGRAAYSLIPKRTAEQKAEARKKTAEKLKSGFQWAKKQAGKLASFKKTEDGYSVTGKTFDFKAPKFGGQDEPQNDLMKYAPYVIGGILLLSMKR
jgi:hypothetical protein